MFVMPTTRRNFIEQSVAGALTTALAAKSSALAAPANSAVTVGLIGAGIRGLELMQAAIGDGAKVAMVCDLYDGHLRRAQEINPILPPLATSTRSSTTKRFKP